MKTALEKAIDLAGGQTQLANKISVITEKPVTQAHVWNWFKRSGGVVPPEYCAAIEQATSGAVKRQELRPTDWQQIWPELIEQEAA